MQGAMQRQGQQCLASPAMTMQQRSSLLLRPSRLASSRAAARRGVNSKSSWAPRAATMDAPTEQQGSTGQVENVAIVGSGPAGYSAAVYAARALLKPVCFEGFQAGRGGQLMGTTEVENYPGFPEGVTGPELMDRMRAQAERWGTELYTEDVEHLDLSQRPFVIRSNEREVRAHSVIVATGATARRLGIPSEQSFWSKGISACAICDGASPLFKNKPVAVVGGGDSAAEEAVYLTKYTPEVHMLVRGDKLRASKTMQDRALNSPKITVHFNTEVEDATGDGLLNGLKLFNNKTGEKSHMSVNGLFYGIGHRPNSDLLQGQVELDEKGYVKVRHGVSTNIEGVFAAGDLHDPEWRQAVTAAGSGCMAALSAERYLTANNLAIEFKPKEQPTHVQEEQPAPSTSGSDEVSFDPSRNKHRGQYALRKLYHETDKLIAVLYTSPTCGPCRSLKPIFSGVADEYADKMYYIEIDIEADPEIAEAAGVAGTPTLQFFKQKDMLRQVPGVKQKREYREMINQFV